MAALVVTSPNVKHGWDECAVRSDVCAVFLCGMQIAAINAGCAHVGGAVSYTHLTLPTKRIV